MSQLAISVLTGDYSLCSLQPVSPIPHWVFHSVFYTVSKTSEELSIIAESKYVPGKIKAEANWKILKIEAVLDLSLTGITAQFSTALANAGVSLCVIATYNTDYIMIKNEKFAIAKIALEEAGFTFNS